MDYIEKRTIICIRVHYRIGKSVQLEKKTHKNRLKTRITERNYKNVECDYWNFDGLGCISYSHFLMQSRNKFMGFIPFLSDYRRFLLLSLLYYYCYYYYHYYYYYYFLLLLLSLLLFFTIINIIIINNNHNNNYYYYNYYYHYSYYYYYYY